MPPMPERILVIRFSSLGDVVLAEPIFRVLKQKYPQAKVGFATKRAYAEVLEGNPNIDVIFTLNNDYGKFAEEVRGFNPDLIIDLHKTFRSRKLSGKFPKTKKLAYPKARWERIWKVLTKSRKPVVHTMERYLQTVGSDGDSFFQKLQSPQTENQRRLIEPSALTVGFGLGAKWETKRWPVEHFAKLAQLLSKSYQVTRLVLFGSEDEYRLGNEFRKNIAGLFQIVFVFGQPLERVKNCLSKLDLLISNDSGLMHLGAALGVPTLGLFGPTHPVLGFAPLEEKSKALSLDLYCSPCSLHGKSPCFRPRRFCLEDLTPEKVFEEANSILKSAQPKPVLEPVPAVFLDRDGVIIQERNFDYTPENIEILTGAIEAVKGLKTAGYKIIVVSNQSGIGRGLLTVEGVNAVHSAIQEKLKKEGTEIDQFYFCPHWPEGAVERFRKDCICRKPETGMLDLAGLDLGTDFSRSFVIGDRVSDLELGWRKKMKSILVLTGQGEKTKEQLQTTEERPVVVNANILEAAEFIVAQNG